MRLVALCSLTLSLVTFSGRAGAEPDEQTPGEPAGMLEAEVQGKKVMFPALDVDVSADIAGDLATVTVVQTFVNPLDKPMHATYLFPLYEKAAVFAMTMDVGEERIKAVIKKKEEALATFEEAKAEGKAAALLNQHRPNMFTQDVANLMPGLPIKVEIRYVQVVDKEDGFYRLVVPLIVGPRYQPKGAGKPPTVEGEGTVEKAGNWELEALPRYPEVAGLTLPKSVEGDRVKLKVRIDGGMPASAIQSRTHGIKATPTSGHAQIVGLKDGKTVDNRDFVLRYRLGGDGVKAGVLAHRDGRGGFFSLLIEPPTLPTEQEISPRELVFVLDCSGSMNGLPMEASKAFMRKALNGLRPKDSFRIIRFSDSASQFGSVPMPATAANVRAGIKYTDGLEGEGGTEMSAGIELALSVPPPAGSVRIVTFLTDGYIGNEQEILGMIKKKIGDARLFAFGVGSAVNRYLLNKMGEMGRGFTRYMDPNESVDEVSSELAARLDAPVLTDISVDWGGLEVEGQAPALIPDLFAGNSVRIQGRYEKPGIYNVKIKGQIGRKLATLPVTVSLPAKQSDGEAIALIWARSMVEDLMDSLSTPASERSTGAGDDEIKAAVTALGLEFSLVTQWTSFVAVSEEVYNDKPETTEQTNVPLPMVKGVTELAYGTFDGSSTPEPAEWLGFALMLCAALIVMRRMNYI